MPESSLNPETILELHWRDRKVPGFWFVTALRARAGGPDVFIFYFVMAKAALIVAFFMQAKCEPAAIRAIIAGGAIWLLIFLSNTVGNYDSRLAWVAGQEGCGALDYFAKTG